jgi:hypothetical protein
VEGPPGTEYIQAVASLDPFDVPQWPSRFLEYDDYYPLQADREPAEFLDYVNHRYFPLDDCYKRCATDYASFEVRREWSYEWDDYYDVHNVYHHYYYDPWDWCGSIYIGYPFGASIWIDGIFYGYAPCFVPRIVVGWHHMRIWYNDYDWYYGRLNIDAGHRHEYVCDDIRYKDSYKHYGFKPKPRGSSQDVEQNYYRTDGIPSIHAKPDMCRKTRMQASMLTRRTGAAGLQSTNRRGPDQAWALVTPRRAEARMSARSQGPRSRRASRAAGMSTTSPSPNLIP